MNPTTKTSVGNETVDQTVTRAKALLAGSTPGAPEPATPGMSDLSSALMTEIQNRMIGSGTGVSSRNTGVQETVDQAIKAQKDLNTSAAGRIQTDYNYEKQFMLSGAESNVTSFAEGRNGFATQLAALNKLTEQTNKNLRDLDVRKQDALAANDATTAANISNLQMKALEFQQQSEQQFYSNAFSLMGLDLQAKAQDKASREFTSKMAFDREQRDIDRQDRMASLAAQYGVEITATETYETLSAKIAEIADEERRLDATKALSGLKKDDEELGQYSSYLTSAIAKGMSPEEAMSDLGKWLAGMGGGFASSKEFNTAYAEAQKLYEDYQKTVSRNEAETGGSFLSRFFGRGGNRNTVPVDIFESTPAFGRGVSTSTPTTAEEVFFGIPTYKP